MTQAAKPVGPTATRLLSDRGAYIILAVPVLVLAVIAGGIATKQIHQGVFAFDFRGTVWNPSFNIRHGLSPIAAPTTGAMEAGNPAVYPPLAAAAVLPLTFLPWPVASVVWAVLLALAVVGSLLLVGVRDWRVLTVVLVSVPTVSGLVFGNVVLLVVAGIAVAWRYRGNPIVCGVALGLTAALKIFTWPLFVWLIVSKRWRASGWAVVSAVLGVLLPWAVVGFRGLTTYTRVLHAANRVFATHSYSLAAGASALGLGDLATPLCLGAGICVLLLALRLRSYEFGLFSLCVLACVVATPIAWPYTFSLVLVPLAIALPRFGVSWIVAAGLLLAASMIPGHAVAETVCCRPPSTPSAVWDFNHLPPSFWPPLAFALAATFVTWLSVRGARTQLNVGTRVSSTDLARQ